jgi:hypothetical protein
VKSCANTPIQRSDSLYILPKTLRALNLRYIEDQMITDGLVTLERVRVIQYKASSTEPDLHE